MQNFDSIILNNIVHIPILLFLLWAVYRKFFSTKPFPTILALPSRTLRVILILLTLGLLAGCSNADPLAVGSGPLFPLNAGHWQPTPQDLAAAPTVSDQ